MINAEDLRIGDIVQTNKDCTFPKDTLCIVTEIHPNDSIMTRMEPSL